MDSERKSSFVIFTALLICMENTFWNINGDGNFVKLFKKSFALYVGSGMRKKTEAVINILRNELDGGGPMTEDFKEKFYMIIIEHCLPQPERKNRKMVTWLQNVLLNIQRGLGERVTV